MLNVNMNQLGTVYATKRRRRNGKSIKPPPKDGVAKSNPSKRHRERLNAELDTLASLLPFEQNILSKLDRLSILRLAVSYLRTKSYFQVSMIQIKDETGSDYRTSRDLTAYDHTPLDGELFLQALNGFLLILTCDGEVFFATHSIESYLGFHQSDIVHQSVYELVHSEDREELQRQLMWNAFLPSELSGIPLQDVLHTGEHCHFLERSFTVRFRCLLDNTSGFLRLDIRGRVKVLHGQNRKSEEPPLALFALCTPFGPPSLLEVPQKEVMFKSKHKLDLSLVSMDQRGKMLIGYSDTELTNMGGYDLVHFDDLAYVASAHQELLKTGASGLIAYRLQSKDGQWQWLQTSSRLVYKNSKPDFITSTHRPLMEEEGRDLLGKRTMDFKVSYLDAGLTNSYFSDQDNTSIQSNPATTPSVAPAPKARRYKTQLRDFLASCRSKRKAGGPVVAGSDYPTDPLANTPTTPAASAIQQIQHAAVAAAATSYNTPYTSNIYGSAAGYPSPETNLYVHHHQQQSFYHHPANFDNRYLDSASLFQYRTLGTYYPEYSPAAYVSNGFLDGSLSRGCIYDNQSTGCQSLDSYKSPYSSTASNHTPSLDKKNNGNSGHDLMKSDPESLKREDYMMHYTNGNDTPRQTVLMWGPGSGGRHNSVIQSQKYSHGGTSDPLRSLTEMGSGGSTPVSTPSSGVSSSGDCKWGVGSIIKSSLGVIGGPMSLTENGLNSNASNPAVTTSSHAALTNHHSHHSHSLTLEHHNHNGGHENSSATSAMAAAAAAKYLHSYHPAVGTGVGVGMGMVHETTTVPSELFGSRYLLSSYSDKQDRSPLLSISEVTNTLLNHD